MASIFELLFAPYNQFLVVYFVAFPFSSWLVYLVITRDPLQLSYSQARRRGMSPPMSSHFEFKKEKKDPDHEAPSKPGAIIKKMLKLATYVSCPYHRHFLRTLLVTIRLTQSTSSRCSSSPKPATNNNTTTSSSQVARPCENSFDFPNPRHHQRFFSQMDGKLLQKGISSSYPDSSGGPHNVLKK